jgi:hypothetical protein
MATVTIQTIQRSKTRWLNPQTLWRYHKIRTRNLVPGLAVLAFFFSEAAVSRAATVLVTNTDNALVGSLRQAIQDASPSDTVAFHIPTSDPGYNAATGVYTITLTSASASDPTSALVISKGLIIDGQGQKIVVQRTTADAAAFRIVRGVNDTTGIAVVEVCALN